VISRQKPEWLIRDGFAAVAASAAAVVYVAVGVQLFYDYEVLHFAFLVFTLYLVFYLKRAITNDSLTFGFGVTATVALTLICGPIPPRHIWLQHFPSALLWRWVRSWP
jgi:hypothetical protein